MKILMIGDIVGQPGREKVKKILPVLKKEKGIHVVIANAENLAHGFGASPATIKEMQEAGVNYFTSGNHIWHNKETVNKLNDKQYPVLRPANYPAKNPGRGYDIFETTLLKKVVVINLQGRVFMQEGLESPFSTIDIILNNFQSDRSISAIVVDFHAEATSEKHALRHYLDGRVSVLVGTHTHVQTNDALITKNGTAYITDLGMTGVYEDSVLGAEKKGALDLFLLARFRYEVADGATVFNALLIETDDATKKAINVEIMHL